MNTLKMLALREWMQHGRAWLWLAAVPLALLVVAALFGHLETNDVGRDVITPAVIFYVSGGVGVVGMCALALLVAALQAPGLARRDVQDRSIEFWLSLPVDHWRAVLVPMAMLLVGMPLLIMAIALLAAPVLGGLVTLRLAGAGGLGQLDWPGYAAAWAALGLRMAVGITVGALWLAPLAALAMAVSAWLKRWGTVVFVGAVFLGAELLSKVYDLHWPQQALFDALRRAAEGYTLIGGANTLPAVEQLGTTGFGPVAHALLADVTALLGGLVSVPFALGLGVAALGVWAQVLRRQRG